MVVVFDLDDTLYEEFDFLKSGFWAVASNLCPERVVEIYERMLYLYDAGHNAFNDIAQEYNMDTSVADMLKIYREHRPNISLSSEVIALLRFLIAKGCVVGLLTDGRKITQYNKIESLGLRDYVRQANIVISEEFGSEKPNERNYRYFMERYPDDVYVYVGDNLKKDFIAPNQLGWQTICLLDNGRNIHKQDMDLPQEYMPTVFVSNVTEIVKYLDKKL